MLGHRRSELASRAGERVRGLLAAPAGGWVPPPDEVPTAQAPAPASWEAPAATRPEAAQPASWDAPPRSGAAQPASEDAAPGPDAVASASWQTPAAARPGVHAATTGGLADLLPVGLRTGRLDPGRRAAAALVVVALLAALVAGAVVLRGRPQEVAVPDLVAAGSPLPGTSPTAAAPGAEVVVAVGGKVRTPGLVRLPLGSRVDDAVRAAGGLQPGASTGLLNLARKLVDGEQVLVGVEPPHGAPAPGGLAPAGASAGSLLDLNTAAVGDFDALPGIGPVLAQRIVEWRTEHGRFASVEQLREVDGIGEAKYEDLRDKVTA